MKTLIHSLIICLALSYTCRVNAQRTYVDFDVMPQWSDSLFHMKDAHYSNTLGGIGGGANKCLCTHADSTCRSIRTIVAKIPILNLIEISGYMRVPMKPFNYSVSFAYKKGKNSAVDFDANPSSWTEIVSFSNTTANGNFNIWTGYFTRFNTILDSNVTVAIAMSSDSPMTFNFDDLLVDRVSPLPVELTSFNAEKFNASVDLAWITASEINNQRFDVLRSTDGKAFEIIGSVSGNGTTNSIHQYAYTDNTLITAPIVYYRLKQIDYDGKVSYSNIIKVSNSAVIPETLRAYPNPFTNQFNWEFNTIQGRKYTLRMNDLTGKQVYSEIIEGKNMGTCSPDINLPHGMYILSLDDNESTVQRVKLEH